MHAACLVAIALTACIPGAIAAAPGSSGSNRSESSTLSGLTVGVGTHMGQADASGQGRQAVAAVRAASAALGVSSLRDEVYWGDFENPKGHYSMDNATPQMRAALDSGVFADGILALGYGNRFYDRGARPTTPDSRAAYARHAGELAKATAGKVGFYEIWNEWNVAIGGPSKPGLASDYIALARATIPVLRSAAPSARILIGGLADPEANDWAFVRAIVSDGLLPLADGISVHLYNYSQGANATAAEMIRRLERLQRILAPANGGRPYPVYLTEVGWPTHTGRTGISETLSGAFLARLVLEAQGYPWLKGLWIYELFDTNDAMPADRESNFGQFRANGDSKAGACFVAGAMGLSKNFRYVGKGVTGSVRWLQFEGGGRTAFVKFAERAADAFMLELQAKPDTLCGWDPRRGSAPQQGRYRIGALPMVITFDGEGLDGAATLAR